LEAYKDILEFEAEHPLTEEPLRMDVLIVKKRRDVAINKNIAAIFRTHNIVEYKSPDDYTSVHNLHKLYAYAYLYVSLNKISVTDISLTIVETRRPRELIRYFREIRNFSIDESSSGIFMVSGDVFPIQVIESKKLPASDNIWLKNLSNDLDVVEGAAFLGEHWEEIKKSGMNAYTYVILHANKAILKEAMTMSLQSQALEPLGEVVDELISEGHLKWILEKYEKIHVDKIKLEIKLEDAKEMFKEGDDIEKIARITKLPMDVLSEALRIQ
jgi:predicted protein tyrosine phosphatase